MGRWVQAHKRAHLNPASVSIEKITPGGGASGSYPALLICKTKLPVSRPQLTRATQCIPDDEVRHWRRYSQLTHPRCVLPPMMLAVRERLQQEDAGRSFKWALGSPRQGDLFVEIGGRQELGQI